MVKRAGVGKYLGLEISKDELYMNREDLKRVILILKSFDHYHASKVFTVKQKLMASLLFIG